MYTYLLLNIFTIFIPLLRSFEKRVYFFSKWKYLFPAIAITGAVFIIWDVIFTNMGVWGFNPKYLLGIDIANLPLEEWLFFITIPYACVFTYEALKYFVKTDYLAPYAKQIGAFISVFCITVAITKYEHIYTLVTFSGLGVLVYLHTYVWKTAYMGRFYFTYVIILIPFFIVNGVLTGTGIEEQVVWYNNDENMGIRMGTIPFEDTFYGMLLILLNVTIYERLQNKKGSQS